MDSDRFADLTSEAEQLESEVKLLLPEVADARRRYAVSESEDDRVRMVAVEKKLQDVHARLGELVKEMESVSGLSPEVLEAIDKPQLDEGENRVPRGTLTADKIKTTSEIDEILPVALEAIERLLPVDWLKAVPEPSCRLDALAEPGNFLSQPASGCPAKAKPSATTTNATRHECLVVRLVGARARDLELLFAAPRDDHVVHERTVVVEVHPS